MSLNLVNLSKPISQGAEAASLLFAYFILQNKLTPDGNGDNNQNSAF